ncbi:MAG TPA: hypothetical protein VGD22_09260 [Sphingobacteriaceae bacterium]
MKIEKLYAVLNFIFFIAAFAVSSLSQTRFFGKNTIADVSYQYDTLFTPAGITFSIWGLIYVSLFAFCIYHLIGAFTKKPDDEVNVQLRQIDWLFIINNMASAAWVLVWVNEMVVVSVFLMIIQLLTLIFICKQAHIFNKHRSLSSILFTQFPISIYFGWITVATVVNMNAALYAYGWSGGPISTTYWTIILIGLTALVAILVIMVKKNVFYGLVIIWAFYGIILKNRDSGSSEEIIIAAVAAIALVALTAIIEFYKLVKPPGSPLPPSVHSN